MSFSRELWKLHTKLLRYKRQALISLTGPTLRRDKLLSTVKELCQKETLDVLIFGLSNVAAEKESPTGKLRLRTLEQGFAAKDAPVTEPADVVFVYSSGWKERALIDARRLALGRLYVAWPWDNHHTFNRNYHLVSMSDFYVVAHGYKHYLENSYSLCAGVEPCAVTQWPSSRASALFEEHERVARSDSLYGGFVAYPGIDNDRQFARECAENIADAAITVSRIDEPRSRYQKLNSDERFFDWMSYKVSLALPLISDVSSRIFDALLAGQIPLVPRQTIELDDIIAPELQAELPVIRFDTYTVDAVKKAHQAALNAYDRDGLEGARRRHVYALQNHMAVHRIESAIEKILAFVK